MTETRTSEPLADRRAARFRPIVVLLAGLGMVSLGTELALVVQSGSGVAVDSAVWVRCSIVLTGSILLLLQAIAAARGSRTAWIRIRIICTVAVAAVVVIVAIPGFLPPWVRLEQAACGVLVLPVAILTNMRQTGALFPKRA